MNRTRFLKHWFGNISNKLIRNDLSRWEKAFQSGYWNLLDSEDEAHRFKKLSEILINHFSSSPPTVLDIGCGYGTLYPYLKKDISSYTGLDFSQTAIEACKNRFKSKDDHPLSFIATPFESFDVKQTFDVVIFNEVLYYFELKKLNSLIIKAVEYLKHPKSILLVSMTKNPKAMWIRWKYFRKLKPTSQTVVHHPSHRTVWHISSYLKEELLALH